MVVVRAGGVRFEGLGSIGAVSMGEAWVWARRAWRVDRQVRQRGVGVDIGNSVNLLDMRRGGTGCFCT